MIVIMVGLYRINRILECLFATHKWAPTAQTTSSDHPLSDALPKKRASMEDDMYECPVQQSIMLEGYEFRRDKVVLPYAAPLF